MLGWGHSLLTLKIIHPFPVKLWEFCIEAEVMSSLFLSTYSTSMLS
jgi:hypothetical protein